MAGFAGAGDGAVVKQRILEINRGMTQIAVAVGGNMIFMFTSCHDAVMAYITIAGNTGMIKTAIQSYFHETPGIVTVIALCGRWYVPVGFTDGDDSVVTGTAIAEYFLVVHKGQ